MTQTAFIKSDPADLKGVKQKYLDQLSAPLDGMWSCFVDMADHYSITSDGQFYQYQSAHHTPSESENLRVGGSNPPPGIIFKECVLSLVTYIQ